MREFFDLITSEVARHMNKLDKKQRIYWVIGALVVLVMIVSIAILSRGGGIMNKIKGVQWPRYTSLIESIDSKYYNDAYFLGCFKERINVCTKDHLKKEISLSGNFLDNINTLTKNAGDENFDNCVWDGVNSCYDLAIKNTITKVPDANNCGSYEDMALRKNCLNESYPKMAISKDDIGICNNNKEPYWLKYCQDSFNQNKSIKNKDISFCDKLSDDSTKKLCRDNYYFSVALATKDISLCNSAGDKTAVSNCVGNFINQSVFSNEKRDCEAIKTYWDYLAKQEFLNMYNRCVMEDVNMQLSKLDPKKDSKQYRELCNKIADELPKKDCIKRTEDTQTLEPKALMPMDVAVDVQWTGSFLSDSGVLSPKEILKKLKEKK